MATEEDPDVLAAFLGVSLQVELSRDLAAYFLEIYQNISGHTLSVDDERFSIEIGRLAATEPEIRKKLIEEGTELPFFNFSVALRTMVEEDEHLHRLSKPLQLSTPGCETEPVLARKSDPPFSQPVG